MKRAIRWTAALLAAVLVLPGRAPDVRAQSSTTTTTTIPVLPSTTTLDVGTDVDGGGRFVGGFRFFGFDVFTFQVTTPVVLLTETSDGSDLCSGDTTMELWRDGTVIAFDDESGPGHCSRLELLLETGDYELKIAGYLGAAVSRYVLDVEFVETECGNGVLEPLEECDDGNFDTEDCCSPECTKDADASACDNGRNCDGEDSCLDGACVVHTLNPCPGVDGDNNCAESCSDSAEGCSWPDPDASPCDDGLFCSGLDRCSGGQCVVHAGDPCRGPDGDGRCNESCKESTDTCTLADPNATPCDDGLFCNGNDTCVGGVCSQHGGNPCTGADGDADCSESCSEAADSCTGPDPLGSPCTDGLFCTGTDSCSGGSCSLHTGNNCPGADGDSNCVESCNEAADNCTAGDPAGSGCNDGLFCNGADTCSSGVCSGHAGNPCPGADGDGNCAESCNETADACTAADPNTSPCNDGLFCNGSDTCASGVCSGHSGNPCPGADGDGNCAESCNETADTCAASDPNGSPCSDGLFCNGADSCSAGACGVHVGSPCPGADGDGNCTESCNEAADACTAADSNGAACNDGLFCNGADTCAGGTCSVHTGSPCPGADGDGNCAESCDETADSCTAADSNGAACNDGLFCNGADTCASGACSGHAGNPCPGADGDGNCSESCNEIGDVCTAADADGSACTDGLFCNGADTCSGGSCGVHNGSPCPGADGDGNCAESCNEAADTCTAADTNGAACNDGLFCNGADTCAGGTCSGHAGSPCPGVDGDSNCAESCNEAGDNCTSNDPNASACDDGVFCNGADTCAAGLCSVHAGNPCPGSDGDLNCSESCNEAADSCTAADPDGTTCDDGLFCNGSDQCIAGLCNDHEGSVCPGADGDGNCAESCSDAAGGCSGNDPAGSPCDDGIFCNGADTCLGGSCSVHAGDPCPGGDGDDDCTESCNEAADNCGAPDGNGSSCSDGLFCNGADTCTSGVCSGHSGNPCPGADGDGDCSESCSEAADACTADDPGGTACNDGLFCNGADTCVDGACSAHAGNPCPGADGDGNCSESCDEAADACSGPDAGGTACNDGLFCNGADACSQGACTAHEGEPCPGADGDGNCAESCNEADDACTAADANGSSCDDGLFCNGPDTCAAGSCTSHQGSPCAGPDGDDDCSESCDENLNTCAAPDADGAACNDGQFCNGSDTCLTGACSHHPGDPCPGPDGDGDCAESCSEGTDTCTGPDSDGTTCTDGDPCTLDDVCDGSGLCATGTPVDCDDDDPCTDDSCTDVEPHCVHAPVPNCPTTTTTTTSTTTSTTLPASLCGDVNGDGTVTAGDALSVLRAAVGGSQCSARVCVCDANGDKALTASDALAVLRKAVGIPLDLACDC